ncbi:hypothetical protein BUALT_Bualt17G0053300 [Buddleja alternifolia]|uniref:ATP-citrate synthase citrate-binding domain-containing protein n=1 Tax=Buddleja alternifolia TaxID=168488 RepID=A0AAV6WBU0_9LAMI|nr:hypothetical protein BUALT_Bualt17G0053300 [Buddleja alternifolia]
MTINAIFFSTVVTTLSPNYETDSYFPTGEKTVYATQPKAAKPDNYSLSKATFSAIIRALKEKEAKLKAAIMHLYVGRGGPNYQKGLARMRSLPKEIGLPIEVFAL